MTANIKFAKVRSDAKIPSKRDEDMGFDIYACFDDEMMIIGPHGTELIPTGIASSCNKKYGFVLRERGSTGSKGIALRAGVIDSGYRNEWFVCLTNTTDKMLCISKLSVEETILQFAGDSRDNLKNIIVYPYDKAIAQALLVPVPETKVKEVSYETLQNIKSERGFGRLGSSNK